MGRDLLSMPKVQDRRSYTAKSIRRQRYVPIPTISAQRTAFCCTVVHTSNVLGKGLSFELVELQIMYRDEVREIVPIFSLQLRDAYEAISAAGAAIDHRKRPDLDEIAQEANQLLRSLDEPAQRRHNHITPRSSPTS
jgi:hypothetical protein